MTETPRESDPAVAPEAAAPPAAGEPQATSNRTTWILFAATWVVAGLVLAYQLPAIARQLRLRRLRQAISAPTPVLDEEALAALAAEGKGAIPALAEELAQADPEREAFRALIVAKLLGPMECPEATKLLVALTQDGSPSLRAHAYETLTDRALAGLAPKEAVSEVLREQVNDRDAFARAMAGRNLVRLGDEAGIWPVIDGLRRLPLWARPLAPTLLETLRGALDAPELALEMRGSPEAQMQQVLAIEAAYTKHGGVIPPGQDLESLLAKQGQGAGGQPEGPKRTSPEPTPAQSGTPTQGAEQQ